MAKTVKFGLEVTGAEKIEAALKNPALVTEPLQGFFEHARAIAVTAATENLDGGTGVAIRSLKGYVNPMSMRVVTFMAKTRAVSIEKGRQSGTAPPLFALVNWLTGTVSARHRNANLSSQNMGTAVKIAEAIRRRGVKGRFFMQGAQSAVREKAPSLTDDMVRHVERLWKAKT